MTRNKYSSPVYLGPLKMSTQTAHHSLRTIEWTLFLGVAVLVLHCGWLLHSANPYEFLRHGGDGLGYYQWLPAVLLDHDVDKMYWTYQIEDGLSLSLFTCGVAILQLPFFLVGHLCANLFGYTQDGFSSPYGVAHLFGIALYSAAGAVLAFRLAFRYSNVQCALLSVLVLFGATNLFFYCVYEPNMSHLYSFFLVGLVSHCGLRMTDGPVHPPRSIHLVMFISGVSLLVLVRQLNIVVLIFPLAMIHRSSMGFKGLVSLVSRHRVAIIAALAVSTIPWILQMCYWNHILGEFITFTYGKKGESFDFTRMVPGMVLACVRNGWFVYSPIVVPLCIWLLVHAWRDSPAARAILLVLVPMWLLYSAWWSWWLGTSYGYRGFIDIYAMLAIPLAWVFRSVSRGNFPVKLSSAIGLVALLRLNFGLMERFQWDWSWEHWNWQRFFEQVSSAFTG